VRASALAIKRWGGRILVLVGIWFVLLGALAHPFSHVFTV
jgi:hypothetical protein